MRAQPNQIPESSALEPQPWSGRTESWDSCDCCDSFLTQQGGCSLQGCSGIRKALWQSSAHRVNPAKFPHKSSCSCRDVTLSILCQAEKTSGYSCLSLETRKPAENTQSQACLPSQTAQRFLNDSGFEESSSSRAVCSTCFASQDA